MEHLKQKSFEKASTSLYGILNWLFKPLCTRVLQITSHIWTLRHNTVDQHGTRFNFSQLDRFDQNWPFHSTFSTHCRYQYLTVSYFPSVLLIHPCVGNNSYIAVLCSVWFDCQMVYFPKDFQIFFWYSKVVFEDRWTQSAKIWKQSAQN